jgi:hypothetical protein
MKSWIKGASVTRLHGKPLWPSEIDGQPSYRQRMDSFFLSFVHRASRYNRVKKPQLDAQLILSVFSQPQHVFGHIYAHHQEVQP